MKKNLLALIALGASVALLAGCGTTTEEAVEDNGIVVEEVVETPVVEVTGTVVEETPVVVTPEAATPTAE